ncbi:tryptophan 2,3-dioxygenase family protein [Actinomycetospora straminea]|uniref:Tryptophan 2,3-dioxygenase n=1 Tax=Actinomycetospora straminea TaxID=663607 RepID=A0ABP9EJI9_9PSEU|nr:tryptophan 2,3-dioxygenase family protein [Actinomycetospora straminea]MDD7933838.1 tryptophan 2,3-dioxygenase family protein [Actinomycetospora straminea]
MAESRPAHDRPHDRDLARRLDALRAGRLATPREALALGRLVTAETRRIGRHALPDPVLDALADTANRHRGRDRFLDAFLDAVLARHRDRFRNAEYLALPLLEEFLRDTAFSPERLSALLLADVVRHESRHPGAVEPALRRKRVRQAMRFLGTVERSPADDTPPRTLAGDWLELTVLPVSTEHDEYFFIRALQAHELVFTTLTGLLRSATDEVRAARPDEATALLRRAASVFERASLLFRLVATMRPAAFHSFRRFTEGASAIQSEAYKRFELACGEPDPARLDSEAFAGVPAVRAEARHHDNLARALVDGPRSEVLDAAAADLEQAHQRWKTTHHSLAARMLGDATGSGYTAGVPYLAAYRENRLMVVRDRAA